jgi:hypothetical protein
MEEAPMRRILVVLAMLVLSSSVAQEPPALTDTQVRQLIVQESIRSYSGSCACPFNVDRAGRRCGGRSAYSRPGGASPICYAEEISDEQVRRYRQRRGIPSL